MSILVSVSVITYNAASFVEETLESIFNQTYGNIELIVSDDCSKDNTIEIVQKWSEQEQVKARFKDIKIVTVPNNTGVSANCNRAIAASTGEWIKFIAGDDILLPTCIEDNMNFVAENSNAMIIFSQVDVYQDIFEHNNYQKTIPAIYPDNLMHKSFYAEEQFKILVQSDRINYTPSYFFNKQTILSVGGYDEKNQLVEDYPMWLKLTKAGIRLFYFHKPTVGYRIHSKATNNTGDDLLFKPSVINGHRVRQKFAHPFLPWLQVMKEDWIYNITLFFKWTGTEKKTILTNGLYQFTTIFCNPFYYIDYIKRKLQKNE
ncbi:glycosyltransferase [Flavobacterium sp.]|jgi:alpha-1,3-rhamnosyltransferase|uniref:glycosyltransferase n=1 Tax=Flavobacterium sp. TaxID=239 RepID=UPI0039195DD2